MTYAPGPAWNVTYLDGKTVTWIEDGDRRAVVSVIDPSSTKPAWRILPGGDGESLGDAPAGLTVYGRFIAERRGRWPSLEVALPPQKKAAPRRSGRGTRWQGAVWCRRGGATRARRGPWPRGSRSP